jgi:Cu+-exporting ATPase
VRGLNRVGGPVLSQSLQAVNGAKRVYVNAGSGRAAIEYDPSRTKTADFVDAIRAAGFNADSQTLRLKVNGLYCAECVGRIESALLATPGVLGATMNAATNEVKVEYAPAIGDLNLLTQAVENSGPYKAARAPEASEPEMDREAQATEKEYKSLLRKWWFAAIIGLPTMILSYSSLFPVLRDVFPNGSEAQWYLWIAMGVASLLVMIYSGSQFFVGAGEGLKHRSANMHTLIALGISVAWLYSTLAVFAPQLFPAKEFVDVYYDVTVVVTALVVLGLAPEIKAKGRTSEAIKKLIGLQAKTARVVRDGKELDIPVEEMLVNDIVIVRPGEKIPVDGELIEGSSAVD